MSDFVLWRSKEKALPDAVEVDGKAFPVRSDFKSILKIFAILNDDEIMDLHKQSMICDIFYKYDYPQNWDVHMNDFISGANDNGGADCGTSDIIFDYDQDAREIYSSFKMLYGIDLIDDNMHWYKFSYLLSSAFKAECPLSEKIRIRTIDVSKCDNKSAAQKAKDAVALNKTISTDEQIIGEEIAQRLMHGEPINNLVGRLKK